MRESGFSGTFLIAAMLAVQAAGCSGGTGNPLAAPPPQSAAAPLSGAKHGGTIEFISDSNNNLVYVVNEQGQVATFHVNGPEGLAVDVSQNLYVTDVADSDVLVYPPPYTTVSKTLSDAGYRPVGVAVDGQGNVAVTSVESNSYGPGSVALYAKGATSPTKTIVADGNFAGDFYCAFDAKGNLYLDSKNGSGPFEAGEVVGGVNGKTVTPLTTENLLQYPGGMQVSKGGKIAILNQGNGSTAPVIYTYNPPKKGSLGSPVMTTTLSAGNDAIAFAFQGKGDRYVLTADTFFSVPNQRGMRSNHEDPIGQTQLFDYPTGGSAQKLLRLNLDATLVGVAVSPAVIP
jgi:hypothetical protein